MYKNLTYIKFHASLNNEEFSCFVINFKSEAEHEICKEFIYAYKLASSKNRTGVINDPPGHTHSLASSDHYFLLFCFVRFEKWGRTYGRTDRRTDNMYKNNDHYRP